MSKLNFGEISSLRWGQDLFLKVTARGFLKHQRGKYLRDSSSYMHQRDRQKKEQLDIRESRDKNHFKRRSPGRAVRLPGFIKSQLFTCRGDSREHHSRPGYDYYLLHN